MPCASCARMPGPRQHEHRNAAVCRGKFALARTSVPYMLCITFLASHVTDRAAGAAPATILGRLSRRARPLCRWRRRA
jgi:hypothetical protein